MKVLITYSSQTGNTLKLAKAVHDTIEGEKEILPIDEAPSPDAYDMVAVGFWFQAGKPDPKSLEYLKKCNKESHVFLFATHGASRDSDHVANALKHAVNSVNGAHVDGVFSCQGEVNPNVLEKVKQKPEPPVWIEDAKKAVGHPNDTDIKELVAIVKAL